MKLVIATPLYPPEIGGPSTYVQLLEEGLPALGIQVETVKFSEVRHLPKLIRHYAYYRKVRRAARVADLVLALDPVSTGLPAALAARREGKPFVVKIVGDYAWEQGQGRFGVTATLDDFVQTRQTSLLVRVLQAMQTSVARSATLVIVPSEYLKKVVTAWGIAPDKISVIYNAVSLEALGTVPEVVTRVPRPVVATVGRLVPWKGVEGLIDAVALMREKGNQVSLIVVGDGPERKDLIEYAETNLAGNCFFTGALNHADTLAVLRYVDLLVLNSSYEGLSHLLIEAAMLGVPTVATAVGGNGEVVSDTETGLLVPPGDVDALAAALERLLSDGEMRARLSARAVEESTRFAPATLLSATARVMLDLGGPTLKTRTSDVLVSEI